MSEQPVRPVPDLSTVYAVWGDIQHMPPYSTVEDRFKRHYDPHVEFISGWFFNGLSVEDRNRLMPRDGVDPDKALRAISAVMRSFEPKHEHKEAGCAQLLHDWFVLAPKGGPMSTRYVAEADAILGWHFVGPKLRDGRPVPADGVTLEHNAPIEWCQSGLYSSSRIIDALKYAPGNTICRVQSWGTVVDGDGDNEKIAATRRRSLWRVDGETLLLDFARQCALDVVDLWDCPDVVRQYLKTGDETLRKAAWAAAKAAASNAERDAAWAAAKAAAWAAAWEAAWEAARASAKKAAWAAARAAAREAARDAAGDAQNTRLTAMVQMQRAREEQGAIA